MSSSSGEDSVGMVSSSDSDGSDNEQSSTKSSSGSKKQRQKKVRTSAEEGEDLSDLSDSSTGSAEGDFTSLLDKATARVRDTIKKKAQKKAAAAAKTKKVSKNTPVKKSSVIYIGHVPHGFYEDQMRGFLSQFGAVTRLRLSRNKKTGRSKHYAFVEFEQRSVAKIVAAAMNGYFLAGRRLVCHVVKRDNVHEKMFKGSNRKFRPIPWRLIEKQRHNAPKSEAQQKKVVGTLLSKEKRKRDKLKELGIDYEFPGYSSAVAVAAAAAATTTTTTTTTTNTTTKKKKKKTKKQKVAK
jgi:nucleolar protein 15